MKRLISFLMVCCFLQNFSVFASDKNHIDFNREIRPILSDKCYACHGPDSNHRKAGLRLDRNEEPFKKLESGKIAIVPSHPEQSELVRRITTSDADDKMPPAEAKQLSKAEVDLLARWVKQGAQWHGHWAYTPPQLPEIPTVHNKRWVRNAIDNFILARLEKEGLKPSRELDKARLIRRVTLDLTGLPPTLEEVDAFLADKSPGAYEKLVDRLLASPAFGERMAQMWLDLARYADTNGYHIDNHRDMWLFRDWVINAFNKNMPFDQFTIEQLAGDMLPNATTDQKIASGFNRNNMVNFEGGADPDEYATKYVVDRIVTTSITWLGSTLACAECHDHKYDPFTQKEFYQMYALFNNIPEKGLDGKTENPVPSIKVPSPEQVKRKAKLEKQTAALEKKLKDKLEFPDEQLDAKQATWEKELNSALSDWEKLAPKSAKSQAGATLTNLPDFSLLASGTNADKDTYEITLRTTATNITGVRLEVLPDDSLPQKKSGRGSNRNFVLTSFQLEAKNPDPKNDASAPFELSDWQALGPFKASTPRQAFGRAFIDTKPRKPDLKQTYENGRLAWTPKPEWKDGVVQNLDGGDYGVYYLYRTITSKSGRQMFISLGSDDGIQVWLNGKLMLSNSVTRSAEPDQETMILWLDPGENHLVIKISNGSGGFGFYFKAKEKVPDEFPVQFASAIADFSQKDFDIKGALDSDPKTGWAVGGKEGEHHATFIARQSFGFPGGTILKLKMKFDSELKHHAIGRFRLAISTSDHLTELGTLSPGLQTIVLRDSAKRTSAQVAEIRKQYRQQYEREVDQIEEKLNATKQNAKTLESEIPSTMVMQEMEKPRDTFILLRGNFQTKGEKVSPGVPKSLLVGSTQNPTNRLQLAHWLISPENPLTARVTVNRFWQMLFGTGLVKTANDFGSQGEWPSHIELLDWLAMEFQGHNWDMKHIMKLMVMSATYRQSSEITPKNLERDPYNRLYARGPRVRLDAEVIRDNALAVSGLLNRKIGGESVRPYQPPGLWEAVAFGAGFSSQSYVQSRGADLYRRGIYVYWKRSLPYPSLVTFDAPSREVCTATRPRTTTPLQALVLMNDPAYIEAARGLAQRILTENKGDVREKLKFAFRVTLARGPQKQELEMLEKIYRQQLANFADKKAAAELVHVGESPQPENVNLSELAAWTAIGNILLNLDETITKG